MQTTADEEVDGGVHMTADKHTESQVCLSDVDTESITGSIDDTDRIVSQLQRVIDEINSNEEIPFNQEFFIRLIKFEPSQHGIGLLPLWKTME
jgi:hypothetical protein